MADVNAWNLTVGHHNIAAMTWFVMNGNDGAWPQYSLEYWQTAGNPVGSPGDLWTALLEGAQYPAGLKGTRPLITGPAAGDFNASTITDGADFLLWQRNHGIFGRNPLGDANADGHVNATDLAIWRSFYGQRGSPSATVPELSTASLGFLGMLAVSFIKNRWPRFLQD
jgi:hypothetical protein